MKWYVYLVKTSIDSLYCGYTNDLNKRIAVHNAGKGAKYTNAHKPVILVYNEEFDTKSDAMKREWQIKKMSRKNKLKLINDHK